MLKAGGVESAVTSVEYGVTSLCVGELSSIATFDKGWRVRGLTWGFASECSLAHTGSTEKVRSLSILAGV